MDELESDVAAPYAAAMRLELRRMDEAFRSTCLLDPATVERQRREAEAFLRGDEESDDE